METVQEPCGDEDEREEPEAVSQLPKDPLHPAHSLRRLRLVSGEGGVPVPSRLLPPGRLLGARPAVGAVRAVFAGVVLGPAATVVAHAVVRAVTLGYRPAARVGAPGLVGC
eukprot:scaffold34516_cov106-Isochrysis_galbana.AAC.2